MAGTSDEKEPRSTMVRKSITVTCPPDETYRAFTNGAFLARLVDRTGYAVSSDETRPVLNGLLVQAEDGNLVLVATDGHRLARARRKGAYQTLGGGFVVPGKTMQNIGRLSREATSAVDIGLSAAKNQAAFRTRVGSYDIVDLKIGSQLLRARTRSGFVGKAGDFVFARIDPVQAHFFDTASGTSLGVRL